MDEDNSLPSARFEINITTGSLDDHGLQDSLLYLIHYLKRGSHGAVNEPWFKGVSWMRFEAYYGHENLAYILEKMGGIVVREEGVLKNPYEGDRPFYYYNVSFSEKQ